ncbi:MAG: UDP-N-acetyl-D-galactosamine dehydrogenase [Candidatus Peregrinibacteria bacterium Gr01-1014_25]|nr:MAG: UDP-N-acetyl-D-galactosamine dehydrogenase [Candidatus Peregrinibacteria bacterium Gr01-1014_25]
MAKPTLCIVGLGYVGLPLAHAFAEEGYPVIGYDVSRSRIDELFRGVDRTRELSAEQLSAVRITYTDDPKSIEAADIVILALPTPVDAANKPDLTLLEQASATVGAHLKRGVIVVYESTVYPGVTEDICGPILEKASGMRCGTDFTLGYSPERINPGDKKHTVRSILKIVAGQDEKTTDTLCSLYGSIVRAGIHRASSIKVAEMAKAIENAQRDLNIAYINEVALLCNHIGIPTKDVLAAAATKWNFLPFQPGLVGGHCIGVDPFYLVEKARQLGMDTHVITAGRTVNEGMGAYIGRRVCDALGKDAHGSRVLVLGFTFKEDIPDTRNSKVIDVVRELTSCGCHVAVHDPHVDDGVLQKEGCVVGGPKDGPYDAVLYLVPHGEFRAMGVDAMARIVRKGGVFFDLKSLLDTQAFRDAGVQYLAL